MKDLSKIRKQPLSERMTIKGGFFTLLKHNPETDIWVYERTYGHKTGNVKKCIEVIKPVYRNYDGERVPTYPGDERFGPYGYCLNSNDYWLEEKLDFYLSNGLKRFVPPKKNP